MSLDGHLLQGPLSRPRAPPSPSSLQHSISFLSQCSPSCVKLADTLGSSFQSWDTPTEGAQRERDLYEVTCRAGACAYTH